jgi:hypothetical protein
LITWNSACLSNGGGISQAVLFHAGIAMRHGDGGIGAGAAVGHIEPAAQRDAALGFECDIGTLEHGSSLCRKMSGGAVKVAGIDLALQATTEFRGKSQGAIERPVRNRGAHDCIDEKRSS